MSSSTFPAWLHGDGTTGVAVGRLVMLAGRRAPVLASLLISLTLCASAVRAQGPLTPSNPMQNPSANPIFSSDYSFASIPVDAINPLDYSLVSSTTRPYNFGTGGSFNGAVTSYVYRQNGSGNLAFEYRFNNLDPSNGTENDIVRTAINDPTNPWTGFTIFNAGVDTAGGSSHAPTPSGGPSTWTNGAPYYIEQSALNSGIGLQFSVGNLGNELLSQNNDQSALIWLETNAKNFTLTNVSLSDTSAVGSSTAYAPATGVFSAVPEPSTLALAACGAAMGLAMARRARKARKR